MFVVEDTDDNVAAFDNTPLIFMVELPALIVPLEFVKLFKLTVFEPNDRVAVPFFVKFCVFGPIVPVNVIPLFAVIVDAAPKVIAPANVAPVAEPLTC
ncbi:MAG: hypothetical protein MUD01_27000 [Chloroflexaceae bacterium]|nr:hypothetical protein [Chloroflexaceae bacterium]